MTNSDPAALIILSEIVFVLILIIMGFAGFFFYRKRKSSTLLKEVTQRIADKKAERLNSLKKHFSGLPQSSSEQINSTITEIVSNEIEFYQNIITAFAENDIEFMRNIDENLTRLVEPYKNLVPDGSNKNQKATPAEDTGDSIIPDIDDAIDELIGDNDSDPALDLSGEDGMAEIPEDLLSDTDSEKAS